MNLKKGSHIHFMGVCGTAMASLAGLMKDRGYEVTGSDSNPYPPMSTQLENLGISIMIGYKPENLSPRPDFVIVGNVISRGNPEVEALLQTDIPYTSLAKAMGEFIIENRESIVISGTHGKTTTTSLMAWVAECQKKGAGFLIGGIPKNFAQSFQNPTGNYFIIEGDEYDTAFFDKVPKFIHYRPRHVILTSIEFDHADIYKDLDDVKKSFTRLMTLIPQGGTLITYADDKNIQSILPASSCKKKITYGLNQADYKAEIKQVTTEGTEFTVIHKGKSLGIFQVLMTGEYNILNATSVIAMSEEDGWDLEVTRQALASFEGVKRRQEILGEPGGILVIEDFAHHPTAVRETIKGVLEKYKGRPLIAVFEPRSATSRRKIFQKDYVEAFKQNLKEVVIAKAFDQSKLDESDRFSSEDLVNDIRGNHIKAECFAKADEIVAHLKPVAQKGDVILIMSNGGFDGIYQKLMRVL